MESEDVTDSEEWRVYEPIATTSNTLVACVTCGGLSAVRYHMYHGVFFDSCSKCRQRAREDRKKQALKNQRATAKLHKALYESNRIEAHRNAVLVRVNAEIKKNQRNIDALEDKQYLDEAEQDVLAALKRTRTKLAQARRAMQSDMDDRVFNPYEYYFNQGA